jgi:hypothetical protein
MPKNFLSNLVLRVKESLPNQKQPQRGQREENPRKSNSISPNLNLLATPESKVSQSASAFATYWGLNLLLTVLFVLMLLTTRYYDGRLRVAKKELSANVADVARLTSVGLDAQEVYDKTEVYKAMIAQREPFSKKIESVLAPLSDVEAGAITLNHKAFSFSVRAQSLFSVASVIATFLQDESVDHLILDTVSLNSKDGTVSASIRGAFR